MLSPEGEERSSSAPPVGGPAEAGTLAEEARRGGHRSGAAGGEAGGTRADGPADGLADGLIAVVGTPFASGAVRGTVDAAYLRARPAQPPVAPLVAMCELAELAAVVCERAFTLAGGERGPDGRGLEWADQAAGRELLAALAKLGTAGAACRIVRRLGSGTAVTAHASGVLVADRAWRAAWAAMGGPPPAVSGRAPRRG